MGHQGDQRFHARYRPRRNLSLTHRQLLVWLFIKAAEQPHRGQLPRTRRAMQGRFISWRTWDVVHEWSLDQTYREQHGLGPGAKIAAQTFADGLSTSLKTLRMAELVEVETTGGRQPKVKRVRLTATGMGMAAGQLIHGMTLTEFTRAKKIDKAVHGKTPPHKTEHPYLKALRAHEPDAYGLAVFTGKNDDSDEAASYLTDKNQRVLGAGQQLLVRSLRLPHDLAQRADCALCIYLGIPRTPPPTQEAVDTPLARLLSSLPSPRFRYPWSEENPFFTH